MSDIYDWSDRFGPEDFQQTPTTKNNTMSSVFQAIQLPVGGSTMTLGPCTFSAKWPAKMAKNNKLYRNVEASDGTGSIKITLWGDAANMNIYDGLVAAIKGNLKRGDYNGTPQLSGENGLSLEDAGPGQQSLPQGQPQGAQQPAQGKQMAFGGVNQKPALNTIRLAGAMARFTAEYQAALINEGMSKEFAEKASILAPQFAAQWFHGEKYPEEVELPKTVPADADAGNEDYPY